MTRWVEDASLEAPDGHRWVKPAPDDCPKCPCHTARVCDRRDWSNATPPTYPDGTAYLKPCPCREQAAGRGVLDHGHHKQCETHDGGPCTCDLTDDTPSLPERSYGE
jgi:hypothetical protein